jgi:hypothetical protein
MCELNGMPEVLCVMDPATCWGGRRATRTKEPYDDSFLPNHEAISLLYARSASSHHPRSRITPKALVVSPFTVRHWLQRSNPEGIDELSDRPRSAWPRLGRASGTGAWSSAGGNCGPEGRSGPSITGSGRWLTGPAWEAGPNQPAVQGQLREAITERGPHIGGGSDGLPPGTAPRPAPPASASLGSGAGAD